ncbi:MAG: hypothetical protein VW261_08060, partial [Flavobacteriaceae bacterium]
VSYADYNAFRSEFTTFLGKLSEFQDALSISKKKSTAFQTAADRSKATPGTLEPKLKALKAALAELDFILEGSTSKEEIGERNTASIRSYLYAASDGLDSTYGPTGLHKQSLATAQSMLEDVKGSLAKITDELVPEIEAALKAAKAPYISN